MKLASDNAAGLRFEGRQAADENYHRYIRARDSGHSDFVDEAVRYNAFYRGDQWDEKVRRELEAEGRPAVTVNLVLPTINTISGEFSSFAADIMFKPKRGAATEELAASLTKLTMHICDANGYGDGLEKDMVDDGLITGRGFLDVRLDFEDNILGEVRITGLDPREVLIDPTAREYDPSTWNEVMTTRWLSLDEIAVLYGEDKAEELRYHVGANTIIDDDTIRWDDPLTYGNNRAFEHGAYDDIATGRTLRSVRIIERQYYKLARVKEFVDPVNGDTRPVPESWPPEKVELYRQAKGLFTRNRLTRKVRWTTSADCVLLHDDWSPYPTFSVIPFFCYFRRGKPFGAVKNLVSPQEIVNKTESQMLHVVNTTANSGWIVDTGALANMTVDELTAHGAKTGIVLEKNPGKDIEKIQPNSVPSGLDNIAVRNIGMVREISGVNESMLGVDGPEVSGIAMRMQSMRGSVQLSTIRDNLKRTRRLLALKILELVQRFYSEERVFYITGYDGDTEEMAVNQKNAAGEIVNDLTVGEYSVVVSSMPARDNFEDNQFAQALELRNAGVVIPDHRVIQYSGLHRKQELMEEVKQLTGFGEQTPQQQMLEQLQMQMIQAQVQEVTAKVEKLMADAQLAQAKAATEMQQPSLEREQMQVDVATTQMEQSVRMQVQRLKEMSAQLQGLIANRTKVQVENHKVKTQAQQRKPQNGNRARAKR